MKIRLFWLLFQVYSASAATLYQWTDASGETRFGYRPPSGVQASPVEETEKNQLAAPNCKDLREQNLKIVDAELARLRKTPTGYGPQFEFPPETRQRLINDLLAHRSALVTGRPSRDFAAPNHRRELETLRAQFEREQAAFRETQAQQEEQLRKQKIELERQRRQPVQTFIRGMIPGPHW